MKAFFENPGRKPTPAELGYRMPAEWERHEATWLAWPHNTETWSGKYLRNVQGIFLQIIEALLRDEKVHLLVRDLREQNTVLDALGRRGVSLGHFSIHIRPTADAWVRDYGPTFLKCKDGSKAWCKWTFNAWGGKYAYLSRDHHVFPPGTDLIPYPCFESGVVLEGGSIDTNGRDLCLTSEQCLLNANRNRWLTREDMERVLRHFLGVKEILWLGRGLAGDDTDGHVDDIARFVDE